MEVLKNILRKMPTDRLREYLKEDNRYVSQAVEYAFPIARICNHKCSKLPDVADL
jgi:hypothetical protein